MPPEWMKTDEEKKSENLPLKNRWRRGGRGGGLWWETEEDTERAGEKVFKKKRNVY